MHECILLIGIPKTGTTAIQSSLFESLRDKRFRLITLDSYFGNRTMLAAFMPTEFERASIFFRGVGPDQMQSLRSSATAYLDRRLRAARRSGQVPIISAEMIWTFSEEQIRTLAGFLTDRGFRPKVYGYIRAPLDMLESVFQQKIRVGRTDAWKELLGMMGRRPLRRGISVLDDVFGEASVDLKYFDPDFFPGRCVVMDFCDRAGIEFDGGKVIRVNESLNLNATKFLHAIGTHRITQGKSMPFSMTATELLKWESLVHVLKAVPGPSLRLHSSLTSNFAEAFKAEQPVLEKRLGRSTPSTLAVRRNDEGIRSEAELGSFDRDTLDWLEDFTGERVGRDGQDPEVAPVVGEMLDRVSILRMPAVSVKIARDRLRLKAKRQFKKTVWCL
ncbi:MAG: hypothetical protein GY876_02445 [Planctomycetes bacterium]|nr:hypothetical protein [Planctomycetota bacterium]